MVRERNKLYTLGKGDMDPMVQELNGKIENIDNQLSSLGINMGSNYKPEGGQTSFEKAFTEATDLIKGAKDEDGDGLIDNVVDIKTQIGQIAYKYGINANKNQIWKNMIKSLDSVEAAALFIEGEGDEDEKKTLNAQTDFKPLYNSVARLRTNPSDVSLKRALMNVILRIETGAAIAADEFANLMKQMMSPDDAAKFNNAITPLVIEAGKSVGKNPTMDSMLNSVLSYLSRKISSEDANRIVRYIQGFLNRIDSRKLVEYALDKIPEVSGQYLNPVNGAPVNVSSVGFTVDGKTPLDIKEPEEPKDPTVKYYYRMKEPDEKGNMVEKSYTETEFNQFKKNLEENPDELLYGINGRNLVEEFSK